MDAAPNVAPEGELRYARVIAALGPKMLDVGAKPPTAFIRIS